jgi:hypothetical protein
VASCDRRIGFPLNSPCDAQPGSNCERDDQQNGQGDEQHEGKRREQKLDAEPESAVVREVSLLRVWPP